MNIDQTQLLNLSRMSNIEYFQLVLKRAKFIYQDFIEKAHQVKKLMRKQNVEDIDWDPPGLINLLSTLKEVELETDSDCQTDDDDEEIAELEEE